MGYSAEELAAVPEGADLGLGCGNPQAIAAMRPGEIVVDLGSGAGFDCFLAARQVGPAGRVIGVDMTHEMLAKARENAAKVGAGNVEFRLGEIEHLPIADNTADVILSNCVINLVPDKAQVFREAFRVLKPGGRLAISDVVNTAPLSPDLAADRALICGCVVGAAPAHQIEALAQRGWLHRHPRVSQTGKPGPDCHLGTRARRRELCGLGHHRGAEAAAREFHVTCRRIVAMRRRLPAFTTRASPIASRPSRLNLEWLSRSRAGSTAVT